MSPSTVIGVDVGEVGPVAGLDLADLGPALPGVAGEPLPQRGLGRGRDLGHAPILARRPCPPVTARAAWRRVAERDPRDNKTMIISSPFVIILSAEEHQELTSRAHGGPDRSPRRDPRPDHPGRRRRPVQRRDRRRSRAARRHRPQVASTVLRGAAGRSGRPAPVRPATPVQRRPGRGGEGVGLRAADHQRGAAGEVELPRSGRRSRPPRGGGLGVGLDGAALAGRRRDQTLAAPVLDLPPRPRLRRQGRPGAGPVRPHASTASRSATTSMCCPPTRNPACKPATASTPAPRRVPAAGRCGSNRSTAGTAPWPTSPPTTSTTPR